MDLTPPPTPLDRAWQIAYRAVYAAQLVWWRVRRQQHRGALVAIYVGGELLLVRSSYRRDWSLPGGGVERGETPRDAASRELREEIGLQVDLTGTPAIVSGNWDGRDDTVYIYELVLPARPALRLDNRELIGARYVGREELLTLPLTGPLAVYLRSASPPEDQHPGA